MLKTNFFVSPLFFSVLTAFLILDKSHIAFAAILFSFSHEMGHLLALLSLKSHPKRMTINLFGMNIELCGNLSTAKKCFVFSMGFAVNFILSVLFFIAGNPLFGCINLIIGIFTAIPLPSSDGGSVLKTVLEEFVPQKANVIFKNIALVFAFLITLLIAALFVFTKNYFVLIALFYIFLCIKKLPPN